MKYLFGTDTSKKGLKPDGEVFKIAETDKSLSRKRASAVDRYVKAACRIGAPLPFVVYALGILGAVAAALAAVLVINSLLNLLDPDESLTLAQYYSNVPALFWAGGVGLACALAVFVLHKRASSKAEDDGKLDEASAEIERLNNETDQLLGIPVSTATADVIEFNYTPDGASFTSNGAGLLEVRVWSSSEGLKLAANDDEARCAVYTVPKEAIKRISIMLHAFDIGDNPWNKEKSPQSDYFRKRGVAIFRNGQIALKYCCALEMEHQGAEYKLLFPAYELDSFCAMTGLSAPDLPSRKELAAGESGQKEPIRPRFYWRLPKGSSVMDILSPTSDYEFRSKHPWAFRLFFTAELIALLLPLLILLFTVVIPAGALDPFSGWALLGLFGSLLVGSGFANIIGAWEHQYLGHWVTIALFVVGIAAMTICIIKLTPID